MYNLAICNNKVRKNNVSMNIINIMEYLLICFAMKFYTQISSTEAMGVWSETSKSVSQRRKPETVSETVSDV